VYAGRTICRPRAFSVSILPCLSSGVSSGRNAPKGELLARQPASRTCVMIVSCPPHNNGHSISSPATPSESRQPGRGSCHSPRTPSLTYGVSVHVLLSTGRPLHISLDNVESGGMWIHSKLLGLPHPLRSARSAWQIHARTDRGEDSHRWARTILACFAQTTTGALSG
jgi:hypothetical protein